jgi:hypothetical protein
MGRGLADAHREELKEEQPSLRTELRSCRLNGSGMNKIVRSRSAIPWSIKRNRVWRVYLRANRYLAWTGLYMTEYLFAARAAIILWTNLAVMPAEILFDAIESELERRGVEADA